MGANGGKRRRPVTSTRPKTTQAARPSKRHGKADAPPSVKAAGGRTRTARGRKNSAGSPRAKARAKRTGGLVGPGAVPADIADGERPSRFAVVALGSSAGGLQSLEEFFANMPDHSGLSFVVVSHQSPSHTTMLPELLQKSAAMPVHLAKNGAKLKADHIYVGPPGKLLAARNGKLRLIDAQEQHSAGLPIDSFLRSLAEDQRDRAAGVTRQLLAFGRQQPLSLQVLDLNELVWNRMGGFAHLLGEGVHQKLALAPELRPVVADPTQMEQVLLNLILNARDAMDKGGELTIETANVDVGESDRVAHAGVKPGPYVRLTVSDTGTGIDAQTRSRMFEPFFTTKPAGKGSGLGLSVVHGIIEQAGGHIDVDTEIGRGTTVAILLPAAGDPVSPPRLQDRPRARPSGWETILVCEDEEMVRRPICRTLEAEGFTVIEAESGDRALELAEEYKGSIHLLLTDIVMPGLDVPELTRILKQQRPNLCILCMSGYARNAEDVGTLIKNSGFIPKPVHPETLIQRVRDLLDAKVT